MGIEVFKGVMCNDVYNLLRNTSAEEEKANMAK